jgi:hypothetical protein
MNDSLETFQRWFWVSLAMFLLYLWLLIFKTRWRESWLRYMAAESKFWSRIGMPRRWTDLARRFGESNASTVCLRIIVLLFALLMILNAGAYVYFKDKIRRKQPPLPTQQTLPITNAPKPLRR